MLRRVAAVIAVLVLHGFAHGQEPAPSNTALFTDGAVRFWSFPHTQHINFVGSTYGNSLGVDVAEVDAGLRAQLELPESTGVIVTAVHAESDAAKAGFQQYDVVLKVDETAVTGTKGFHELMNAQQGKDVKLHVLRKGKPAIVAMTLPKTPVYEVTDTNLFTLNPNVLTVASPPQYRIGLTLAEADETLRRQLRLAKEEGLVVTEVVPESPAAKAGLQPHDVLIKFDGKRLTTVDALNTQVQELKDQQAKVVFLREGRELSREVAAQLDSTGTVQLNPFVTDYTIRLQPSQFVDFDRDGMVDVWTSLSHSRVTPTTPAPTPAEQMAALKQQLAEVQKAMEKLEAALKPAAPENPPPENK